MNLATHILLWVAANAAWFGSMFLVAFTIKEIAL
jgi:hypothetical protein